MNLQESIRRILREGGYIPSPIMRRISNDDLEEAFDYALETMITSMDNPNSVIFKEKKPSLWVFSKFVIDDMVTLLEQEYFNDDNRIYFSDTDEDDKTYHEKIRQPLLRHYGKRIKKKYYEVMSSNDEEIIQENIRRVLREELLNETKFFLRRINDLDEIKDLLAINVDQTYNETKSYDQFKYELTLRVVESIMWNRYGIGWEDLPEQEEIDYVTQVSNTFEKKIKQLYKEVQTYYNKHK